MKFNILALLVVQFFSFRSLAAADDSIVCRGEVYVPSFDMKAEVVLSLPLVKNDKIMALWHPITSDEDSDVSLTIHVNEPIPNGVFVFATYDYSHFSGFITFKYRKDAINEFTLVEFKGFEGKTSFGPSDILCKKE
ncbi:MAG: hypothetical protein H6625_03245 [Bdellovibrionaceae bacterium]|nr:hypothetical protein [Pseudobdellovibrionaceae bacterium]